MILGVFGAFSTVHVNLPRGITEASVVSSVYRYQTRSQADGTGGAVVTLYLDVPIV